MKLFKNISLYSRLSLITSLTLVTGYVLVFAYTNLVLSDADSGKPLTSTLMQTIMSNVNELNTRLTSAEATITSQTTTISTLSPSGAVIAFNLASCPTGWTIADGGGGRPDLRGEFIRGLDNGRGVDIGRTLRSSQADIFANHTHNTSNVVDTSSTSWNDANTYYPAATDSNNSGIVPGMGVSSTGGSETRPRNVALLYCVKN
ncbi:MAG: hypothetical protein PHN60_00500 [Candidatus Gracilibacteria bacterium]|nr:hypothetical protein [Candidatus Gracilibacteria bacterium]